MTSPEPINQSMFSRAYKHLPAVAKNKKTASFFALTLSFFTLSFFGLFAIRPTFITAVTLIKNVSELKQINIKYEDKIGSIIKAQTQFEQIRNSVPLIESALPANTLFSKLADRLEKFAKQSNLLINQLQIDNVSISNLPPSNKLSKFGFSLTATGNYQATSSFIQHLINWKRIITIDSLETVREGIAENKNLRIVLKATAYYEP